MPSPLLDAVLAKEALATLEGGLGLPRLSLIIPSLASLSPQQWPP